MSVRVEDIADGLVTLLNSSQGDPNPFGEAFTAEWDYVVDLDFEKLKGLKVQIVPRLEPNEPDDKEDQRFEFECGIIITRKLELTQKADKTTVRPLLALPRLIRDFLMFKIIADCSWENTTLELTYSHKELREGRTLVSSISTSYSKLQ